MKYFIVTFLCISSCLFAKGYKHELSICTIFKDDAKYIPEWVEFHKERGVEHFYLYENLSSDNFEEILAPYVASGLVEIIPWHSTFCNQALWNSIQCNAYMDCVKKHAYDSRWIAFLDTDEYLFSPYQKDLRHLLWFYRSYGGVSVNWVMYGSSYVERIPPGERMIDHLLLRGPIYTNQNRHVKTIVQPRYVLDCVNPHYFVYRYDKHAVTEKFKFIEGPFSAVVSVERLRINHYWQRDGEFFESVFIPRKKSWGASDEYIESVRNIYNDEFDDILAR